MSIRIDELIFRSTNLPHLKYNVRGKRYVGRPAWTRKFTLKERIGDALHVLRGESIVN